MKAHMRKLDVRGVDKGYPKRLQTKYGTFNNRFNEITPDKLESNLHTDIKMSTNSPNDSSVTETLVAATPSGSEMPSSRNTVNDETPPETSAQLGNPAPQSTDDRINGDPSKIRKVERAEKRHEPQTPFEFIEAFYTGRSKSLTESIVRRIKNNALAIDSASRGTLLRLAQSEDETLDKTRRLMLIASEEADLKPLGHLLIEFAVEVICLNKAIHSNGMRVKLFPNYSDESALEDAWKALSSMKLSEDLGTMDAPQLAENSETDTSDRAQADGDIKIFSGRKGNSQTKAKAAISLSNKARRNALLCSVIWRIHKKHVTFPEAMRAMRNTIFYAPIATALEADLLEAIALMPEKEDSRVALLLEWQAKQQLDISLKLSDANQRTSDLTVELAQVANEKNLALEAIEKLRQDLLAIQVKNQDLHSQLGVVQTHGQADHEALRSLSLRIVRESVTQLESVTTALGRDPPKVDIAIEVLNTVADGLKKAEKKLGEI